MADIKFSSAGNFTPSTFQKGNNVAFLMFWASLVAQTVKKLPAVWETWVYPWFRKIPWIFLGTGNPLQYSCLENLMDGGAWWATVHGVGKSRTRLSDFTSLLHFTAIKIGKYSITTDLPAQYILRESPPPPPASLTPDIVNL